MPLTVVVGAEAETLPMLFPCFVALRWFTLWAEAEILPVGVVTGLYS